MATLRGAVHTILIADATLISNLASDVITVANPAVFTGSMAPEGQTFPYIVCTFNVASIPYDTKTTSDYGQQIDFDIRCYHDRDVADAQIDIDVIAEAARAAMHDATLTVTNFVHIFTQVINGPFVADEEDVLGRILTVRTIQSGT